MSEEEYEEYILMAIGAIIGTIVFIYLYFQGAF